MAAPKGSVIIVRKKKGGGHGGHHGGAWKVAYADFVTAMMAFFLVMWLMGVDEETKAEIAGHFNGTSQAEISPLKIPMDQPKGGSQLEPFVQTQTVSGRTVDLPVGRFVPPTSPEVDLLAIVDEIENSISVQLGMTPESPTHFESRYEKKGVVLRIVTPEFFAHGKSEIIPDMSPVLSKLGNLLAKYKKHKIRIEGHTEPTEESESDPSVGWKLSTARAQSVVQFWLQRNEQWDPRRIQLAGASYYHPIGDNSTTTGRATNRRIEITVLPADSQ